MEILFESLVEEWYNLVRLAPRAVAALTVFLIALGVGRVLGRVVLHVLARGKLRVTHRNFFRSLTLWLSGLVGVFLALNVLGQGGLAAGLLAGGGITAVVLGFAFREIGENFLAGFFLAFSRPFDEGDLIECGGLRGVVRTVELRFTHIRSSDGRDIFIPSGQIFKSPLVNFTRDGLRRVSFSVGIDYRDDAAQARRLLTETARTSEHVEVDPRPGCNITALGPQYVELDVFLWVNTFRPGVSLAEVRNEVIDACRRALVDGGFTVSSNVASNVELVCPRPIDVQLSRTNAAQS